MSHSFHDVVAQATGAWLSWMMPMSWQLAILVGAVAILTLLLRKRSALLRYAIWVLVVVRLLLPPSLAFPTAWGWWLIPAMPSHELAIIHDPVWGDVESGNRLAVPSSGVADVSVAQLNAPSLMNTESAASVVKTRSWLTSEVVFIAWASVVALLLARLSVGAIRVRRLVQRAIPVKSLLLLDCLDSWRKRLGIRRQVGLLQSDECPTPLVVGVWRPVILVPTCVSKALDMEEMETILLHELHHVSRFDVAINVLQAILEAIYFFHPLVWWSNARLRQLREYACDELTVAYLKGERRAYGSGLVKVAQLVARRIPGLALTILESPHPARRRLARILDPKLPHTTRLGWASLAFLLAAGTVLLPAAGRQASKSDSPLDSASRSALEQALLIANRMSSGVEKDRVFQQIAVTQSGAGDFERAVQTVGLIENTNTRIIALSLVAKSQAISGDSDGAVKTFEMARELVTTLKTDWAKVTCLRVIGMMQTERGDTYAAREVLTNARTLCDGIEDVNGRINELIEIAKIQFSANDQSCRETLEKALDAALLLTGDQINLALRSISAAQAQCSDIEGALNTADLIVGRVALKDRALVDIIAIQATIDTKAALETVEVISSKNEKADALSLVAVSLGKSGDRPAARSAFQRAKQQAQETTPDFVRADCLRSIAERQAVAGDFDGALETARIIRFDYWKALALAGIAAALADSGNGASAHATLQQAMDSARAIKAMSSVPDDNPTANKSMALTAIVRAQAKLIDQATSSALIKAAIQEAVKIEDDSARANVLGHIARVVTQQSDEHAAMALAAQEDSPIVKLSVLLGISDAKSQLSRSRNR